MWDLCDKKKSPRCISAGGGSVRQSAQLLCLQNEKLPLSVEHTLEKVSS